MAIFNRTTGSQLTDLTDTVAPAGSTEPALSIIAHDMKIVGDLDCGGVVKIEGTIEGSVKGARQVLVGRQGLVKGNINTREAVIGGRVEGGINASERVEIQGTAMVNGDIRARSMVVQEGGRINGAIHMEETSAAGRSPREGAGASQTTPVAVVR